MKEKILPPQPLKSSKKLHINITNDTREVDMLRNCCSLLAPIFLEMYGSPFRESNGFLLSSASVENVYLNYLMFTKKLLYFLPLKKVRIFIQKVIITNCWNVLISFRSLSGSAYINHKWILLTSNTIPLEKLRIKGFIQFVSFFFKMSWQLCRWYES